MKPLNLIDRGGDISIWTVLGASCRLRLRLRLRQRLREALVGMLVVMLLALAQGVLLPPAFAGDFPGKGSYQAWVKAGRIYNEANRLEGLGRYDEALDKYRLAISNYPHDGSYYHNMGLVYKKKGDLASAESAYRNATALNPSDWQSWAGLATVVRKEGMYEESKKCFVQALQCHPPNDECKRIHENIVWLNDKLRLSTRAMP